MPDIRPLSDLIEKIAEIEETCMVDKKPVFLTKDGYGHLVVMSQKRYEEHMALLALYNKSE